MPAEGPAFGTTRLFVIGANFKTCPLDLRDRMFVEDAAVGLLYERLRRLGIHQAVALSTCDRVEIHGAHSDPERAAAAILEMFADRAGRSAEEIETWLFRRFDEAALRHIFSVSAALESQIVGEPQVLGQVKDAHRLAQDHGMVGPGLDSAYQAGFRVAKQVRTDTRIGERPVTLATAAVQLARDLHGDLSACSILMLGLGDIADLVTQQLRLDGAADVTVTGPSVRTEAFAFHHGLHYVPFEDLQAALASSDVVVSAVGSGKHVITQEIVRTAVRQRRQRPILLIDGGVPSDVDPKVDEVSAAFRYTLDDLERTVMESRRTRESESEPAWAIVDAAIADWRRSAAGSDAVPALVALRQRFEAIRREVVSENPNAGAEEVSRRLVNRLLHEPSVALRAMAEAGDAADLRDAFTVNRVLQRLFGLALDVRDDDNDGTEER